jgi:hypothetical protein
MYTRTDKGFVEEHPAMTVRDLERLTNDLTIQIRLLIAALDSAAGNVRSVGERQRLRRLELRLLELRDFLDRDCR